MEGIYNRIANGGVKTNTILTLLPRGEGMKDVRRRQRAHLLLYTRLENHCRLYYAIIDEILKKKALNIPLLLNIIDTLLIHTVK